MRWLLLNERCTIAALLGEQMGRIGLSAARRLRGSLGLHPARSTIPPDDQERIRSLIMQIGLYQAVGDDQATCALLSQLPAGDSTAQIPSGIDLRCGRALIDAAQPDKAVAILQKATIASPKDPKRGRI
jgi:hypothetical protein